MTYFKSLPPLSEVIRGAGEEDKIASENTVPEPLLPESLPSEPPVGRITTSLTGIVSEPPIRVKWSLVASTETKNPPVLKTGN